MRSGFSLLELSIVLVIIGLLAGGVMTGQSLIRAAEIRAVVTEYQKFTTAVNAFRDKYQSVPGDFKTASSFWGLNATCPGISTTTASAATCNGDGDGNISPSVSTSNEQFRFWQHLALAGLTEGTYTGTSSTTTATADTPLPASNVPASKVTNAGWRVLNIGSTIATNGTWYEGNYGNALIFANYSGAVATTGTAVLKPEEMWNVDTKLDDGKPGMGLVVMPEGLGVACSDTAASTTTTTTGSTAAYALSVTSVGCTAVFKNIN